MLTDSVPISALISQGILIGGVGWDNTDYFGTNIVSGVTIKQVKKVIVPAKDKKRGKVTIDESETIRLGGAFEQIGGDDEATGGGSQKVGSANQQ